jgi:hypothetical protein
LPILWFDQVAAFHTLLSPALNCAIFERLHPYPRPSLTVTFRKGVKVFLNGKAWIADKAPSIADFARPGLRLRGKERRIRKMGAANT